MNTFIDINYDTVENIIQKSQEIHLNIDLREENTLMIQRNPSLIIKNRNLNNRKRCLEKNSNFWSRDQNKKYIKFLISHENLFYMTV